MCEQSDQSLKALAPNILRVLVNYLSLLTTGRKLALMFFGSVKLIAPGRFRYGSPPCERSEPTTGNDPGIGVITATAMVATVVDASAFKSGRHFAAWIGLVPQQNGTGGKVHLGRISKKGEPYLRRLLALGATAVVRYARNKPDFAGWVNALLARRPARVVTVAVANKLARIVWAIMQRCGSFRERSFGIA